MTPSGGQVRLSWLSFSDIGIKGFYITNFYGCDTLFMNYEKVQKNYS